MKKVLVIQYSQSGQLSEIVRQTIAPLAHNDSIDVTVETIKPIDDYPFPWPFLRFFDTFPEAVYMDAPAIEPLSIDSNANFDLVILAYQVWFLSPSLPISAFLQSEEAKKLLNNKPVITLIGCRNMWLMAQEEVKNALTSLNASLIGNIVLTDEAGSAGSFLATPVWVLSGKKGPHLKGLIPKAGVAPKAIKAASRFGERICQGLTQERPLNADLLKGLGAVTVNEKLIASEKTAKRSFRIWGKLLRAAGAQGSFKRKPILILYIAFLISFIVVFIPISVLIKALIQPFTKQQTAAQKNYFEQPSGSSNDSGESAHNSTKE